MSKKNPESDTHRRFTLRCSGRGGASRRNDGFNVVINYAGEHGSAGPLIARIQQVGWSATVQHAGVSDAETDDASFDHYVAINLKAVFNRLRAASKRIGLEDLPWPRIN
jgi:hypothetical protein